MDGVTILTRGSNASVGSAERPRRARRRLAAALGIARWVLVAGIAMTLAAPAALQLIGGIRLIVVEGGSMRPTYEVGDVLVVRPPSGQDLHVGAVVVVGHPPTAYTHRVVAVDADGNEPRLTTRGDANATDDPDRIVESEVTAVPIGAIAGPAAAAVRALSSTPGTLALAGAGVLLALGLPRRHPGASTREPEPTGVRT